MSDTVDVTATSAQTPSVDDASRLKPSDVRATSLPLEPRDFYVLSSLTEEMTVGDLKKRCAGVGEVEVIVARLIDLGAVALVGDAASGGETGASGGDTGARASATSRASVAPADASQSRAPRRLKTPLTGLAGRGGAGGATRKSVEKDGALKTPAGLPDVTPTGADDPRIEPNIELEVDFQRMVLAAVDAGRSLNAFRVLGIAPTEDERRIKRAFHALSRKLHPDAYFGKEIGSFERRLEQLFTNGKRAFTELKDQKARDFAVTEWYREESGGTEQATRRAAEAESVALAQRKIEARERSERNAARIRSRARRQARTTRDSRAQQAQEVAAGAKDFEAVGKYGDAIRALLKARQMVSENSEHARDFDVEIKRLKQKKGAQAFERAMEARRNKSTKSAAAYFEEAAEHAPSTVHLAEAALALATMNPARARGFAMDALKYLARERSQIKISAQTEGRVHYCCAVAFRAAGTLKSAVSEARHAQRLLGDTTEMQALLKSLSLT